MPKVNFSKKRFLNAIGEESYTNEDIEGLFAKLGMEATLSVSEGGEEEVCLEFCANRYDLSGMEGAVLEVRCFLGKDDPLFIKPDPPKIKFYINGPAVRPYAVGAVLRGINFDDALFRRFIDVQEKLHENACRHRQYVAIGTHDLDSLVPPFYFRGEEPSSVKFIPLKSTLISPDVPFPENPEFTAPDLFKYYDEHHLPLGKYTYLLNKSPAIAVIRDSNGVLLSLPPLVNGEHSRCSLNTKNVFIDVTGTDRNKVTMVVNVVVTLFAKHSASVEYVEIIHGTPETPSPPTELYPLVDPLELDVAMEDINGLIGLNLTPEETVPLLKRKQIAATVKASSSSSGGGGVLHVTVPAHRADVMHSADIAEDVLIAYGVDNIDAVTPSFSITGSSLLAEDATEQIRQLGANNGYVEMYNFVLLSVTDGFLSMLRPMCAGHCGNANVMQNTSSLNPVLLPAPSSSSASSSSSSTSSSTSTSASSTSPTPATTCRCGIVSTLNGKSTDTEAVRLSLVPCLLKSLRNNNHHPKPTLLFEVGDVVVPDYAGCAYAFVPHPQQGVQKRCEEVCGGGCCAATRALNPHNTLTSAVTAGGASGLAPNAYVAPLFEYPNTLGIIRADSGSRNERHFSAVRCGPDVSPENLIPVIARLLGNFRLLFNSAGPRGLTLPPEVLSKAEEEDPALRKLPDHVLNGVAGYWEMLPPSALAGTATTQTSSYVRWVSDSASFIDNNFTLICVTLQSIASSAKGAGAGATAAAAAAAGEDAQGVPQLYRVPLGIMGILRPDVVKAFSVHTNVVAFELNLEPLYVRLL